jgi:septal ring factor EnvC (AmiA/AmiB activator)
MLLQDGRLGERRGDELPQELVDRSSRRARLRAAKERLEAEVREAQAAHAARLETRADLEAKRGKKLRGRRPVPPPDVVDPSARANVTDPDSRLVRSPRGFVQVRQRAGRVH